MKNTPKINLHLPRSLSPARYKSRSKSPSLSPEPNASTNSESSSSGSNKLQPGSGTMTSGSATGNPRNKCALQPGHSLMDWIRLGNSGKDLAGTGGVYRPVTPGELAAHNKPESPWIAIRGKVYNIVDYLDYHPGGPDELMRGAGKDATQLFDQVHAWVNYESLLSKCLIGPLKQSQISEEDFRKVFESNQEKSDTLKKSTESLKVNQKIVNSVSDSEITVNKSSSESSLNVNESKASNRTSLSNTSIQKASVSIVVSDDDSKKTHSETSLASKFKYPTLTLTKADSLKSEDTSEALIDGSDNNKNVSKIKPPKFDWIQKTDSIVLIFYTKPWCNPQCNVSLLNKKDIRAEFTYDFHSFTYNISLEDCVNWPCVVNVNHETGKVEIYLRKETAKIWKIYGNTDKSDVTEFSLNINENGVACSIIDKWEINHNTTIIQLKSVDDEYITFPIGYHTRIYSNFEESISRPYTPIPPNLTCEYKVEKWAPNHICFMIKKYDQGVVSTWLTSRKTGDNIMISRPLGSLSMTVLKDISQVCLIAAGTGLTPMINLLNFSLQRRNPRCTRVDLLFFNRSEKDILWHDQLSSLASKDDRFHLTNFLSDPSTLWNGNKGHINQSVLKNHFARILHEERDSTLVNTEECDSPSSRVINEQYFTENRKILTFVCGPSMFTQLTKTLLSGLGCPDEKMYCFIG